MALDFGRYGQSTIQQRLDAERRAGIRDPEGQAAFKKGVGIGSYAIPGSAQIKAGAGILGKLAPAASAVYQSIRGSKAIKNTIGNQYVGTALTGIGINDAIERTPEMIDKFKQGDIGGGIQDASMLALETMLLPAGLRESGKVYKGLTKKIIPEPKALAQKGKEILDSTAGKVAKVTKENKGTALKATGVVAGTAIPEIADAYTNPNYALPSLPFGDADPTLRDEGVKKDNKKTTATETSDDETMQGVVNANNNVDTPSLDQQVKPNVVNQDLIPDVDMSDFKKGTAGDAGPTGTDAKSMNMNLAKNLEFAMIDKAENDSEQVIKTTNKNVNTNLNTLTEIRSSQIETLPSHFLAIKDQIQTNFENSSKKLDEYKETLESRERETFEEFSNNFRERVGKDYSKQQLDYIILKMGLDMMSGRSYEQGLSGFLDILGRAGGDAVESGMAIVESEKALQEGLALKYGEYEKLMDENLRQDEKDFFNAQLSLIQSKDTSTLALLEKQAEARMEIDKLYYKSLFENANKTQGTDFEPRDKTMLKKVIDPDAYLGFRFVPVVRNKTDNVLYASQQTSDGKGGFTTRFVPAYQLGLDESGLTETSKTDVTKATSQIHYASDGKRLLNLFFQTVTEGNLSPGANASLADTISGFKGKEDYIRSLLGLNRANGKKNTTSTYVDALQSNTNGDLKGGGVEDIDMRTLIRDNTDPNSTFKFNGKTNSDTASMVSSYDEDMQTAREFANSSEGDTFVEKFYENAYGGISKDPKKIKDQIRKALARYKVIETNLTYIVANANKAEDRLTQADIAEAKKLTELISSKDDSEVIIEKYNLINQRIDKNFEKNAKILLRNNQETSQTLITQFGHMDSIKKHQLRLILKEKEKEAKAFEDLSADELMKYFN